MGIVLTEEIWEGRQASFKDTGSRQYTRNFRVVTDYSAVDGLEVSFGNPALPKQWTGYRNPITNFFDDFAVLRDYETRQEDGCTWIVTCRYDTDGPVPYVIGPNGVPLTGAAGASPGRPGSGQGSADKPEMEPWAVSFRPLTFQAAMRMAYGRMRPNAVTALVEDDAVQARRPATQTPTLKYPVKNLVGDPYTELPTFEDADYLLTVSRNEREFDPDKALAYKFALNSDPYLTWAAGQCKMLPIEAEQVARGRFVYYRVTYKIAVKTPYRLPDGEEVKDWQPRVLEQGFNAFVFAGSPPVPFVDHDPVPILDIVTQQPLTEPKLLSYQGQPLKPDQVAAGTQVIHTKYYRYRELPFAPFKLNVQFTLS